MYVDLTIIVFIFYVSSLSLAVWLLASTRCLRGEPTDAQTLHTCIWTYETVSVKKKYFIRYLLEKFSFHGMFVNVLF